MGNELHLHMARNDSSRWQRFLDGPAWLILKNVIGWLLILLAFVVGPLIPGPGGIPLFLLGFALINFPGKRRLTARVLRGKPITSSTRTSRLFCAAVALVLPAIIVLFPPVRHWGPIAGDPVLIFSFYALGVTVTWLALRLICPGLNFLLGMVAKSRRRIRPWLRHHHIRLLPPRRRRRHPHEPGDGPLDLGDGEILRYTKGAKKPA